ncbi:MAG: class I SAM-dependent methyltransferase [Planctomycetota bacterium]|jgi:SAM-dependent methyltransferase
MEKTGELQSKQDYWKEFYSKEHILEPSDFCKTVADNFALPSRLFDLCCGNGRDTYHLGKYTETVIGVDYAAENKPFNNVEFIKSDLRGFLNSVSSASFYCRFGIHAIEEDLEDLVLDKGEELYLEFRSDKDRDFVDDHYRRLINADNFMTKLHDRNYIIETFIESQGLAIYKEFDPWVIRVIAKRK